MRFNIFNEILETEQTYSQYESFKNAVTSRDHLKQVFDLLYKNKQLCVGENEYTKRKKILTEAQKKKIKK